MKTRWFRFSVLAVIMLGALFLFVPRQALAATCTTTATGTSWNSSSHWSGCGGLVPQTGDIVVIANATTLDVSSNTVGTVTINSSITLTIASGGTLNSSDNLTVNGTLDLQSGGAYSMGTKNVTIASGGSVTQSGGTFTVRDLTTTGSYTQTGGTLKIAHDLKGAGTFSASAGTVQFTATAGGGAFPSGVTYQLFNVIIDSGVDPRFDNNAITLNVKGDWTNNSASTDLTGNATTIVFNGSSSQTIGGTNATTFINLTINSGATVQLTSGVAPVINTTITINGTIITPDTVTVTNDGTATVTLGSSGLIQTADADGVTGSASTSFGANFTTTSIDTNGTVEYNRSGNQTITGRTYQNLTTSGSGTKTPGAGYTVNNTFTIGSGTTVDEAGFTGTIPGGATLLVNGTLDFTSAAGLVRSGTTGTSTLTMGSSGLIKTVDDNGLGPATNASFQTQAGGAWSFTNVDTAGTVEYARNATSGQTVTDRDYNKLTITGSSQTKTWTLAATRTVNSDLTINSSAPLTLSGTQTVNVKGNWSNGGTFTAGTSTIGFTGTGAQTIGGSNSTTFSGLTINNSGGSVTLSTAGTVSGLLTLTSDLTASATLTQSGTCSGAGDVIGTVSRSDQGTTTRCFGNTNNQITFASGGGTPTGSVTVNLTKSTPSGFSANVVSRYYTITSNTWTGSGTTLRLRYLESELPTFTGGKSEADLVFYKRTTGAYSEQGGTVDTTNNHVTNSSVSSFSDWAFAATGTPTSIILTTFKAKATTKPSAKLKWETGSEINVFGFNVYRATKKNGEYQLLNDPMIAALHPGEILGDTYKFKDKTVKHGKTYYYKIEIVKSDATSEWSEAVKVIVP